MTDVDCPHCAELREEVAWLRSELGLQEQDALILKIKTMIDRTTPRKMVTSGRPQAARFIAALYAANGRPMTHYQLLEAVPARNGLDNDERGLKIISVWAYMARCALGRDAVQTHYGEGYRLTDVGMARVAAELGETV